MAPAPPDTGALGPLAARALLMGRDDQPPGPDPHRGVTSPQDINNNAMFALFGLIGVAFVAVGIWFFFWAKNGGFHFKESDWDDYKSTVLRRKGPNGTILSGATPSTNLGGGSIYKDIDDQSTEYAPTTVISGSTNLTGITGGVSDLSGREKRRRKRDAKERDKERKREEKHREKLTKKSGRKVNAAGELVDEEAEAEAAARLRDYRHEKPARVGGLNKAAEGSSWDGSTNPSNSTATETSVTSELMSHREKTPTSTPTKSGGIRKVYSTADRNVDREAERIRAEARRLQEKGRAAVAGAGGSRRDFSYQRAPPSSHGGNRGGSEDAGTHVPGSWTESEVGSETGTKAYRHHIPGISSGAGSDATDFAYRQPAEEGRRKRGASGYRRQ